MYKLPSRYDTYYKNYINRDSREFEIECAIEGNIVDISDISSIYIDHDLISGAEEYTIGNLATAKLSITVASRVSINEGDRIDLTIFLVTEEKDAYGQIIKIPVPMGRFYAFNINSTKLSKTIEAYDDLYKAELEEEYNSNYTYLSTGVREILEELCGILSITCSPDIPNSGLPRPTYVPHYVLSEDGKYIEMESDSNQVCFGMNVGQALSYIAAYLGGNFIVDGNRQLKLVKISTKSIDAAKTYLANEYASPSYGETSYLINTVHCTISTKEVISVGENSSASYTFENPFYISRDQVSSLLNTLKGISYKPVKVKAKGDITLQPGDLIGITPVGVGETIYFPALRLRFSFTGGCSVEIEAVCKTKSEKSIDYKGTITSRIDSLETTVSKVTNEVDELSKSLKTLSTVKEDIDNMDRLIDSISNDVSSDRLYTYNQLLRRIIENDSKFYEEYESVLNNKYLT
jgi:hypothetical protein